MHINKESSFLILIKENVEYRVCGNKVERLFILGLSVMYNQSSN